LVDGATIKSKTHLAKLFEYCSFPYIISFLAQSCIVFRNSFAVDAAHRLTPTPCFALLTAANRIGDEGAAAVAGALEPRRNEDGSWSPSTALTKLALGGEWVLMFYGCDRGRLRLLMSIRIFPPMR
jgi:hypothetical protein